MALNSLLLPYNKISEVEECKPISSPSSTMIDKQKSVPDLLCSSLYKSYNFQIELPDKKFKSSPSSIGSHNFHDNILSEIENENFSSNNKKEIKKLNFDQDKNIFKFINDFKELPSSERESYQTNKLNSPRPNLKNLFQKANDVSNTDESNYKDKNVSGFEDSEKNININNIYNTFNKNPKINPVKEDKQLDSFFEEISHMENKIKSINTDDKDSIKTFNKREIPEIIPKVNEINRISNISLPNNFKPRISNPTPFVNGIYRKKKISDSRLIGKKSKNIEKARDSSKTEDFHEIKAKNRQLILNARPVIRLKIKQLQKILKNDSLFYLLRFLDYFDIINLYKARNKQLCILLNTALANAYYFSIKEALLKYNNVIELLKCTIVQSKIKDALKIDFVISIRFINDKNENKCKRKIKLRGEDNKFVDPLYFQFCYVYNYFQKVKNKKELITKEEYESLIKRLKMYDYYTFDLYPEQNKNNNTKYNNPIFISKELSLFEKDGNNNIVNIQPILPFSINDRGIINLEIYTTNNGFIDPDSIKIIVKSYNLKNYIKTLTEKGINNPRLSECEDLCVHWKNINLYQYNKTLIFRIKKLFLPFFEINKISFENIGVYIFKVCLTAVKAGEINKKNNVEIIIKVKEKDDYIENEIRKNNLLFERRDIFELKVGDQLIYYFSSK